MLTTTQLSVHTTVQSVQPQNYPCRNTALERSRKGEDREGSGGKSGRERRERWEGARGGEEMREEERREADSNSLIH